MSDEKKIYVDEDWKSQVEAEREAAQNPVQEEPQGELPQWPEPSLPLLVTTLATQAMVGLGLVEHPLSGKGELDLPQAKHFIDTIVMLKEKSEGNRTEEETTVIENVLHELQMVYVQIEAAHSGSKPSE